MKTCEYCGKEFPRKTDSIARYMKRKYCSLSCSSRSHSTRVLNNICQYCGKEINRKTWTHPAGNSKDYTDRKYCCLECVGKAKTANKAKEIELIHDRQCLQCGRELTRNIYREGTWESMRSFSTRKFCGISCYVKYGKARCSGDSINSIYRRAKKNKKEKCCICGHAENLHLHHVDKNFHNNDPSNLMTLCQSCHHDVHGHRKCS